MTNQNTNLPWVEKYRPNNLSNIVHHKFILKILRNFLKSNSLPHLFFYGPPGTGKTSTILSCAQEIYGKSTNMMVLHLNASDERGVEVVRKQIIQFVSTSNLFCCNGGAKLVILDEADSLTEQAQVALRDTIMQYGARFCLIGNFQYTLIPSLQSRVVKLLFTPVPLEEAVKVASNILDKEGIKYDEGSLHELYSYTGGDLRKYINVLQALSLRTDELTVDDIKHYLCKWGNNEVENFIKTLKTKNVGECYKIFKNITYSHSQNFSAWLNTIALYFLDKLDEKSLILFCDDISNIEYNASFMVHLDTQLFCFVACCHRFAQELIS